MPRKQNCDYWYHINIHHHNNNTKIHQNSTIRCNPDKFPTRVLGVFEKLTFLWRPGSVHCKNKGRKKKCPVPKSGSLDCPIIFRGMVK